MIIVYWFHKHPHIKLDTEHEDVIMSIYIYYVVSVALMHSIKLKLQSCWMRFQRCSRADILWKTRINTEGEKSETQSIRIISLFLFISVCDFTFIFDTLSSFIHQFIVRLTAHHPYRKYCSSILTRLSYSMNFKVSHWIKYNINSHSHCVFIRFWFGSFVCVCVST